MRNSQRIPLEKLADAHERHLFSGCCRANSFQHLGVLVLSRPSFKEITISCVHQVIKSINLLCLRCVHGGEFTLAN